MTAERVEIAREVHDSVAHALAIIVRQAEAGQYVAASSPERAQECLRLVADVGRDALHDMRRVLGLMRAADSAHRPAGRAQGDEFAAGAGDIPALVTAMASAGLLVDLQERGHPGDGPATPASSRAGLVGTGERSAYGSHGP